MNLIPEQYFLVINQVCWSASRSCSRSMCSLCTNRDSWSHYSLSLPLQTELNNKQGGWGRLSHTTTCIIICTHLFKSDHNHCSNYLDCSCFVNELFTIISYLWCPSSFLQWWIWQKRPLFWGRFNETTLSRRRKNSAKIGLPFYRKFHSNYSLLLHRVSCFKFACNLALKNSTIMFLPKLSLFGAYHVTQLFDIVGNQVSI